MLLLVTFCNQFPSPRLAAAVVHTDTGDIQWLDVPDEFQRGAAGITRYDGGYLVACQAGGVVRYDAKLRPTGVLATPGASSLHSILYRPDESALYVVSTGNDSLLRYDVDDALTTTRNGRTVYCADPAGAFGDRHHLNSLTEHQGELYVSMFGVASGPNHLTRRRGLVVRVSDGEAIATDLYHPHTLFSHGDELLVIESQAHALRRIAGGAAESWPIHGGYPRGIAAGADARHLWIGASARRRQSASLGTPNDTAGVEPIDFRCRLVSFDLDQGATAVDVDLTSLAVEIFDLCPLPSSFPFEPSPQRGLRDRVEALQQAYADSRHEVWLLERELDRTAGKRARRVAAGARRRLGRYVAQARRARR